MHLSQGSAMDQAPFDTASNLKTEIIDLCGRMHGAEYRLLHRIRQLDEIEDWTAAMPSCAHWLPFPWMPPDEVRGWSPYRALGGRRRDAPG